MSYYAEQIETWKTVKSENENLEFKEAKNGFDREKLFKYCVAISNEKGGHLVLGMADSVPRRCVGTNAFLDPTALKSDIRDKTRLNVDIFVESVDAKRILIIKIPSRPLGSAYDYKGAYLMRSGESLVSMTEDRLRAIFAEGQTEWGLKEIAQGVSGAHVLELLDYEVFEDFSQAVPVESISEKVARLEKTGLIVQSGDNFSITRLAAITLARNINDFPEISRKASRLIVYNGNDKLDTRHDVTGQKGYAAGFQGLVRLCMQHMPQNEVVQDALRKTVPLFPERALREVIANALIHQDLTETGVGPVVEIFKNRIEVSNPGVPVVPVDRLLTDTSRETKNWLGSCVNSIFVKSEAVELIV